MHSSESVTRLWIEPGKKSSVDRQQAIQRKAFHRLVLSTMGSSNLLPEGRLLLGLQLAASGLAPTQARAQHPDLGDALRELVLGRRRGRHRGRRREVVAGGAASGWLVATGVES